MMRLTSGRTEVALHELRADAGPTLLCLHALRGQAADFAELAPAWPGRVLALDFAGHGASGRPRGGSYTPELLAGDVDAALDHIEAAHAQTDVLPGQTASRSRAKTREPATLHLLGVGIGAYIALLVAGARPERVRAAYLLPGAGLEGGGAAPRSQIEGNELYAEVAALLAAAAQPDLASHDPMVRLLEADPRPPDYARSFADRAARLLLAEDGSHRPPWWEAARESVCALRAPADPRAGLALLCAGVD
jgi:pimeloyl-ACP methyl ester carboxylesterase